MQVSETVGFLTLLIQAVVWCQGETVIQTRPPNIYKQPPSVVYFKSGESVQLPCQANGIPKPTYLWLKNKLAFIPSGNNNRIVQLPGEGTLVFTSTEQKDEGIYQCTADNGNGKAVSINVNLREGKLKDFNVAPDEVHRPFLGESLTLNCVPPVSFPPALIEWVIKDSSGRTEMISYDNRVSMDLEGRLQITNIKSSDYRDGKAYACMALNYVVRRNTFDRGHFIIPTGATEIHWPPMYQWSSPSDIFTVEGQTLQLQCIFSGNPTPVVYWIQNGQDVHVHDVDQTELLYGGQLLKIPNIKQNDSGTYECYGKNTQGGRKSRTFQVHVESTPKWTNQPKDIVSRIGQTVTFLCDASGIPSPTITWFINGERLDASSFYRWSREPGYIVPGRETTAFPQVHWQTFSHIKSDSAKVSQFGTRFLHPSTTNITFVNLRQNDDLVVQCNASNVHGYEFSNAVLNVLSFEKRCLQCSDVNEPRSCDRIEYCNTGDVCAVKRYRKNNGDLSYWTGCTSHSDCGSVSNETILHHTKRKIDGVVVCSECCHGDICNVEGCGAPSYPVTRGPICFDCSSMLQPTDCHKISICGTNEACDIYLSAPTVVGKKRFVTDVSKRSYKLCMGCCHGDFCNIQCNSTFPPGTVINTGPSSTSSPSVISEIAGNYSFYASLLYSASAGPVVFGSVYTNEGNAYDNNTGEFTCKYSGDYVFTWTISTSGGTRSKTDILLNSRVVGPSQSDSIGNRTRFDSSTGFVVLTLKLGDKVFINITNQTINSVKSTFSGWRINGTSSAFYVRSTSALTTSSTSRAFQFQDIVTNVGGHYKADGKYVCPQTGYYAFAFAPETDGGRDFMVYFYVNGQIKSNIGVWPDSYSGHPNTASTMQIFHLDSGDSVYMTTVASDNRLNAPESTFAGWFLDDGSISKPAFLEQLSSSSATSPVGFNVDKIDRTFSFSMTSGFICPVDGVYVFFWNVEASSRLTTSRLSVNGIDKGFTDSDGRQQGYDSGSNVVVLHLRMNDKVNVLISATADEGQTMISGYLLY